MQTKQNIADLFNSRFQQQVDGLREMLAGPPIDEERINEVLRTVEQLPGVVAACMSVDINFDQSTGRARIA